MIFLILLSTLAHARTPSHEEYTAWLNSPERIACFNVWCGRVCDSYSSPEIEGKCFDSDGSKFCARIDGASSQASAQTQAASVAASGAADSAARAIVSIASGANENDSTKIIDGMKALEAARELKNRENIIHENLHQSPAPFIASKGELEKPEAVEAFDRFERRYGISGEELSRKLLSGDARNFVTTELGIELEKIPKLITEGGTETESVRIERQNLKVNGLREKLARSLASKEETQTVEAPKTESLTPSKDFELEAKELEPEELTLFDVIHIKYRTKENMFKGETNVRR